MSPASATALDPGLRLGSYEIVELIGRGGMGEVYLAHDARLGRNVAIKILQKDAGPIDLVDEAQAMAKLSHRNVVTVFEMGESGGRGYVAMEHIDGLTLRGWLAAEPRTWREIVAVYVAAGRGLAAAHAAGIIHRDFKPENVLVGRGDGRACVTDFGLAGAVADLGGSGSAPGELETMRFSAAIAGTPAYMAPEQYLRDDVDARADQFAFCVALYEALYGERPFPGRTVEAIRTAMLAGPAQRPAGRTPVPAWLRSALLRGLAIRRADRFPSMDALLAVLDRDPAARRRSALLGAALVATTGLAIFGLARTPSVGPVCDGGQSRLGSVWNPRVSAAVRGALEGTGRANAHDVAERVLSALDRYAIDWSTLHREVCAATEIRHEQSAALLDLRMDCLDRRLAGMRALAKELSRPPDPRVVDGAVSSALGLAGLDGCSDAAALSAVVPPPDDPALRARIAALRDRLNEANARGVMLLPLNEGEGKALVDEARAIGYDPLLAEALGRAARLAVLGNDAAAAEPLYREAVQAAARAHDDAALAALWTALVYCVGVDEGHPADAFALRAAAEAAVARAGSKPHDVAALVAAFAKVTFFAGGRYAEVIDSYRRAQALYAIEPADKLAIVNLDRSLGTALAHMGRHPEAERTLLEARDLTGAIYGQDSVFFERVLNDMGIGYWLADRLDDAQAALERAVGICERLLGPDHRNCAKDMYNLAAVLARRGRLDEALEIAERALAIKMSAIGVEHPDSLESRLLVSDIKRRRGDLGPARALAEWTLAVIEKTHAIEENQYSRLMVIVGRVDIAEGKLAAARASEERALALMEKFGNVDVDDLDDVQAALVEVALAEGRNADALTRALHLVANREQVLGKDRPLVAAALVDVGRAQLGLGRPVDAAAALERAVAIDEHAATDPHELAEARFVLARALEAEHADRARARGLAEAARSELDAEGGRAGKLRGQVVSWLTRDRSAHR